MDADYGDVISFHERLKAYCQENDKDLWFVMNGDWIDGTGLAMDGDSSHVIPILEKMPFDVVNTGNHELYRSTVVEYMTRPGGFIDWWGDKYLASNVLLARTKQSLSNRYIVLEGRNSNVLVFGFLYNLPNPSEVVIVAEVEKVVKEKWFQEALKTERFDSIMIMAHMAYDDPLVVVLLTEIRVHVGHDMPVQFVTGHTHYRRYMELDPLSTSFEAGRYLDTVGFVSFPIKETASAAGENASDLFRHVFIDANVKVLQETLGVEKLRTESGNELSTFIQHTQEEMGLKEHIGCTPRTYYLNRSMFAEDSSLWKLYKDEVVPSQLDVDPRTKKAIFLGQGSWRYDLLRGKEPLEVDDIIAVSPFNEPIVFLGKFPGSIVLLLNESMNQEPSNVMPDLPRHILAGSVSTDDDCMLYTHHHEVLEILETLRMLYTGDIPEPQITNMTSTSVWMQFVKHQWPCEGAGLPWLHDSNISKEQAVDDAQTILIVFAFLSLAFSFGGMLCLLGMCCKRARLNPEYHYDVQDIILEEHCELT